MSKKRILIGVLLVFVIVGGGYLCGSLLWGSPPVTSAGATPRASQEPEFRLGGFRQIQGTKYLAAEVVKDSSYSSSSSDFFSSSKADGRVRNIIFLDSKTLITQKLFDDNSNVILNTSQYPPSNLVENQDDATLIVKWLVYQVVEGDSNHDGALNNEDVRFIASSDVGGRNYQKILENIEGITSMQMLRMGQLIIVYRQEAVEYASILDLETQEVVETKPIVDYLPSEE